VRPEDVLLLAVVIAAATAARIIVLFGLLPFLTAMRASPVVERPYRVAIVWGGLRGAVTLALALAVTESFRVPVETKRIVAVLATGYTLFTLIVQGTTLRWVISALKLDRLSPLDQALSNQVIAVALQTVREDVAKTTENYNLTRDIVRSEAKRFGERLDGAVGAAEKDAEILDRDRITLGLIALAGAERDMVLDQSRERTFSTGLAEQLLADADRLIEATRTGGRIGYGRAARASVGYGAVFRAAVFLNNRLRISAPLARMTASRFELLLAQRLILRDLDGFIDRRIRRIHGRRVAELLHELLARRVETVETALEGLRLQYPGYAEELERRFIRRTALRLEEREYATMRGDGLIGAELHTALIEDISRRRLAAEQRPRLDVAVQRAEIVRQFPLFDGMDDTLLRQLSRALRTRYVDAGEVIMRRDAPVRSVYFVASGAVEMALPSQPLRLGRGEMFGQLAILTARRRPVEVRAITPSILLVLDETRFRRLLRRSAALREAVLESARKRGLSDDLSKLPEFAEEAASKQAA
jgi:monovalent cation:H+ antiporter, CPA1 family